MPLAKQLFYERPTLYGSLIAILQSVEDEYDDFDAMPTVRFDRINQHLVPPMLTAIDAQFDPAQEFLAKVDALHTAWFTL